MKYKNSIIQAFSENKECKDKTYISYTVLEKVLTYLSIGLKSKHLDYIISQLFKISNNLQKLDYQKIFSIFVLESLEYRSPSPSPLRKTTTASSNMPEEQRSKQRSVFKYRTSMDVAEDKNVVSLKKKYLYFGQGYYNEVFKTYYIKDFIFKGEEVSGIFYYDLQIFEIKGEFIDSVKSVKFSAISKSDRMDFDGLLLNKSSLIQGTLKVGNLEEDLAMFLVDKIWKYEAKYTNNKINYEFNGFLTLKRNTIIEGKGVDILGEYSIKGILDRDFHMKFTKNYNDNSRIIFEGAVQKNNVVGHYELDEEEGEWSMVYEEIE